MAWLKLPLQSQLPPLPLLPLLPSLLLPGPLPQPQAARGEEAPELQLTPPPLPQ